MLPEEMAARSSALARSERLSTAGAVDCAIIALLEPWDDFGPVLEPTLTFSYEEKC